MLQPTWLVDTLAVVMIAISTYCVARLVAARVWGRALHRDINVAHVAMGTAMAGALVAGFRTLPDGAWELVFGALVLWFGASAARLVVRPALAAVDTHHLSHNLTHMVMAGAMLYMFMETSSSSVAAATPAAAMSLMGGARGSAASLGGLTLVLVFILFASAVWHFDGLTRYTTARRQLAPVASSVPAHGTGALMATVVAAPAGATTAQDVTMTDAAQAEQAHWLAPRLEMGCHIAMCITMGYMLVLLL